MEKQNSERGVERRQAVGRRRTDTQECGVAYPVIGIRDCQHFVNVNLLPNYLRTTIPSREVQDEAADVIEALDRKIVVLQSALNLYHIELRGAADRRRNQTFFTRMCESITRVLSVLQPTTPKRSGDQ